MNSALSVTRTPGKQVSAVSRGGHGFVQKGWPGKKHWHCGRAFSQVALSALTRPSNIIFYGCLGVLGGLGRFKSVRSKCVAISPTGPLSENASRLNRGWQVGTD
jgi:hypothetical protein